MSQQTAQHVWYYQKSTITGVRDEGPFSDAQMLQLAKENKLSLKTVIRSPTRTNSQWILAENVPTLAVAINQGRLDADAQKKASAESAKQHKQQLAVARQQAKADVAKAKAAENRATAAKANADAQQAKAAMHQSVQQQPQLAASSYPTAPQSQTIIIQEAPRQSGALGAVVNLFFPGFGQLVQGRLMAALVWWGFFAVSILSMLVIIGWFTTPLLYILCIVDAAWYKPKR